MVSLTMSLQIKEINLKLILKKSCNASMNSGTNLIFTGLNGAHGYPVLVWIKSIEGLKRHQPMKFGR